MEKRIDSNKSRQRKKGSTLRNKILKKDAVPSVFPSYPSSYTYNENRRSDSSHSDIRRSQQIMQIEEMNESFLKNDQVTSVQQIHNKLLNTDCRSVPTGFQYSFVKCDTLLIYVLSLNDTVPIIKGALVIDPNLDVSLSVNGNVIRKSQFSHL